jgi:anti-sigma B factor antagonist
MEFNKPFQVIESRSGPVVILHVIGKVHSGTAQELDKALGRQLGQRQYHMVVDMEQVPFISSAGLRSLLAADRTARVGGGRVVLAALQEPVRQVFEMSKLNHIFSLHDSVEKAINSLT